MNHLKSKIVLIISLCIVAPLSLALPQIGAAPKGEAKTIASKIIKYNFPICKKVSAATRMPDGSILATCDSTDYLVFTMFNAKEGKTLELAMNCSFTKQMLKISC